MESKDLKKMNQGRRKKGAPPRRAFTGESGNTS